MSPSVLRLSGVVGCLGVVKKSSISYCIRRGVCLVRANGLVSIYGVMVPVINDDVRLKIHSPKCVKLYQIISHAHLPQSWSPVVRKE